MGSSHGQPNVLASIWSALRRIGILGCGGSVGDVTGDRNVYGTCASSNIHMDGGAMLAEKEG